MESISKQFNKSIDQTENPNQIDTLQNKYNTKYLEILILQDDPTTPTYHRLYNELEDLLKQIETHLIRG